MKYKVLKRYFGYETFREGQEELIDALLKKQDVFGPEGQKTLPK